VRNVWLRCVPVSAAAATLLALGFPASSTALPLTIKPDEITPGRSISVSFVQPRSIPLGHHVRSLFIGTVPAGPLFQCTWIKEIRSAKRGAAGRRFYLVLTPRNQIRPTDPVTTRWCLGRASVAVAIFRNSTGRMTYKVGQEVVYIQEVPSF
jgi:hypothetical protein